MGYMKGMNHFFQVCSIFTYEMSYLGRIKYNSDDIVFETFANALRSGFLWRVRRGKAKTLEDALRTHICDLKKNKFITCRINPFLTDSNATWESRKLVEITPNQIFKRIQKMRQHRIIFYECILKEYKARKNQYNQRLREYLDNKHEKTVRSSITLDIDYILSGLEVDLSNRRRGILPEKFYKISNQAWYLNDLMALDNPEIDRYTKRLPRYRAQDMHAHPEGLKVFFELFSVFKSEMSLIIPISLEESFFEKVLATLKHDFLDDFERQGDLEEALIEYINELEKFEFLSLPKEKFFDKISKMIYNLRARRIEFYETILEDYLANKDRYDKVLDPDLNSKLSGNQN